VENRLTTFDFVNDAGKLLARNRGYKTDIVLNQVFDNFFTDTQGLVPSGLTGVTPRI